MADGVILGGMEGREPIGEKSRKAALEKVKRILRDGSEEAARFQVELVEEARTSEDMAVRKLGFLASEAILDRTMGKAAQEIRVGEAENRPIMFDGKLASLAAGVHAALGRELGAGESALDVVVRKVVEEGRDREGVTI